MLPAAEEAIDPLVPAGYDLIWSAFTFLPLLLALIFWVVALVQIAGRRDQLPGASAVLWVILVTAIPLAGTIAWFVAGPRSPKVAPPVA